MKLISFSPFLIKDKLKPMHSKGVEPSIPYGRRILNPERMPVPPRVHKLGWRDSNPRNTRVKVSDLKPLGDSPLKTTCLGEKLKILNK